MVKSPKVRHSKSITEPVTIDLDAKDVKRVEAGDRKAAPEQKASDTKPATSTPGTDKAPSASSAATATGAGQEDSAAKPASGAAAASSKPTGSTTSGAAASSSSPSGSTASSRSASGSATTGPGTSGPATPSAFGRDGGKTPPPPRPEPVRQPGRASPVLAGIVGGLVVLAAGGGGWYAGLLPERGGAVSASDGAEALRPEIEALRTELAELRDNPPAAEGADAGGAQADERFAGIDGALEDLRNQIAEIADAAPGESGPGAEALDALRADIAALQERIAAAPQAGDPAELEALRGELAELGRNVGSAVETAETANSAATAAGERLAAIEQSMADLSARVDEHAETPGVALAISASALKTAIDRGAPFMAELETYAGLAPDAAEVDALREMAASGVPTRAAIEAEADAAAVAMIEAGRPADPSAGLMDRLWASAQSLVTVRPVGEVEGDGVPETAARIEAAVKAGDYERAITEYETLPPDAKAAGSEFMDKVRARHSADELVGTALAAALRA